MSLSSGERVVTFQLLSACPSSAWPYNSSCLSNMSRLDKSCTCSAILSSPSAASCSSYFNTDDVPKPEDWSSTLICTEVVDAHPPEQYIGAFQIDDDSPGVRLVKRNIDKLLMLSGSTSIVACTEWRDSAPTVLASSLGLPLYHSFMILETDDNMVVCTEKYSDYLEIMCGTSSMAHQVMERFRPTGARRGIIIEAQPRCILDCPVPLRDFLEWVAGPLALKWKPYNLLFSNCQHYSKEVQEYLSDPQEQDIPEEPHSTFVPQEHERQYRH